MLLFLNPIFAFSRDARRSWTRWLSALWCSGRGCDCAWSRGGTRRGPTWSTRCTMRAAPWTSPPATATGGSTACWRGSRTRRGSTGCITRAARTYTARWKQVRAILLLGSIYFLYSINVSYSNQLWMSKNKPSIWKKTCVEILNRSTVLYWFRS